MRSSSTVSIESQGPVSIGAQRTEITDPPDEWAQRFRETRSILLPNLFEPQLLQSLLDSCNRATFATDAVAGLGTREVEAPQRVGRAINLILSRPEFIEWVGAIAGCKVARAEGRVVQTRANAADQLDWHDDMNEPARRLGITISLSEGEFEGGWFELRDAATAAVIATHRHECPGEALIFEIGPHLQHRLLPVTRGAPRRVFTG
jgi:hypothetical protein